MSIKQRKNKKRYSKTRLSKKNNMKFWRRFRLGFSSKAQARRALRRREEE